MAVLSARAQPHEQQYKEWFSRAFVQAISASAGVAAEWVQNDMYGVDVVLRRRGVSVDVQLKATSVPEFDDDGAMVFDLDVATYNALADSGRMAPAYLVVVTIGSERSSWVGHVPMQTGLLHEARWLRISGLPQSPNSATVRLKVPASNLLTARAVARFVDEARGEWDA